MKPQLLAIIGGVLVLLIIGAVAVYFVMFRKTAPVEDPAVVAARMDSDGDGFTDVDERAQGTDPNDAKRFPGSHKKVIVARKDISSNTLLGEADFQVREVAARGEAPDAAIIEAELARVVGRISSSEIREGDFLTEAMLFGGRPQLSYLVPKYKRAVSLRYDQLSAVSGLVKLGDLVDVIGHFRVRRRDEGGGGEIEYSRTLVQTARVIALGQAFLPKAPGDTTPDAIPTGLTVAIYPHEAEQLIWAENYPGARLVLALRSPVNDALARTSGVTDEALFGSSLISKPQNVEVYYGGVWGGVTRFERREGDRLGVPPIAGSNLEAISARGAQR